MKETAISEPNANSEHFEFLEPGQLVDGELKLRLDKKLPADPFHDHVPAYLFHMIHRGVGRKWEGSPCESEKRSYSRRERGRLAIQSTRNIEAPVMPPEAASCLFLWRKSTI